MRDEIDITNKWLIGSGGGDIVVMLPTRKLSKQDALVFAAYLVSMVGDDDEWQRTLAAVQSA